MRQPASPSLRRDGHVLPAFSPRFFRKSALHVMATAVMATATDPAMPPSRTPATSHIAESNVVVPLPRLRATDVRLCTAVLSIHCDTRHAATRRVLAVAAASTILCSLIVCVYTLLFELWLRLLQR